MPSRDTPRRAALYGRVSKAQPAKQGRDPGTTTSVDQQLDVMLAQAHRENVTVIGPFRDDGVSASRYANGKTREGWQQTMAAITSGSVTELWTWEISRATRDRPVWAALIGACIAGNVRISVAGGRPADPSDPDEGFMLDLQAGLAVRESALTSKRILRDVKARAEQGKPHGKIPYGYRRDYHPQTRALIAQVPDPATAPIVQEMARRVLAGESMYSIAADLNDRGVPSPEAVRALRVHGPDTDVSGMKWLSGEVRDQVRSPTPAGLRARNGVFVAVASWPAIISVADHERLKAMLEGPGRAGWFGPAKHLLTGIAECGVCGTPLRRVKNRGYPSYACPGPLKRGDSCVARVQEPLDTTVGAFVVLLLQDPDLLAHAARLRAGDGQRASAAERELADLRATRAEFVDAAKKPGTRGAIAALEIIADYDEQIEAAKARMGQVSGLPQVVLDMAGPDAEEKWDAADVIAQRQVLRAMVRVVVNKSARGRGVRGFDRSSVAITPRWLPQASAGTA